ncbi:phosphoglycolate phosphatase [Lachnospiraceae bacterium KH1T2]|nr:phosphoglycolate phosphatase [Lachnospiraceae bacterium KH1T2]
MIKAAIFDLDGTIGDTVEALAYCVNKTIGEFGLAPIETEKFKFLAGDGARMLIKRALEVRGVTDDDTFEKVFKRYNEIFAVDCLYHVKPYEGIPELIKKLKEAGIRIAVFSNKQHPMTLTTVNGIFPEGTFDEIRGQKDGYPKKPAPDGALAIAEKFGVKPEECMYLGDTNTDMQTGKAAGMFTIGVLWGFRTRQELEENKADAIIESPLEAIQFVK